MNQAEHILSILKTYISPKRVNHSKRVSLEAKLLAAKYKLDQNVLELAGLVHDIAKNKTPDELAQIGIDVTPYQNCWENYPSVWHALIAPEVVAVEFPNINQDVCNIIQYHTTGAENMTKEAMVLFIADFIEPERDHPNVDDVRIVAEKSLEKAVALITKYSIEKLNLKSVKIHPFTTECWNYYCNYIIDR